jgi:hypothetical protein
MGAIESSTEKPGHGNGEEKQKVSPDLFDFFSVSFRLCGIKTVPMVCGFI